jgi:hypothetical protein
LVQPLLVKVLVSSMKKVSRHAFAFASLAFEPVTSTNSSATAATGVQASAVETKSNDALPFGGNSIKSFDYAFLFSDKPSSTYWLVVASVRNEDFNGHDSPAKQRPVPNDDPAIEISLWLCVPIITTVSVTSTAYILAITTALTGQNLLLLCVRDDSAVKLLLLHCIRDDPAIMMATYAKPKLQLVVVSIQKALSARSMISLRKKLIVMLDSEEEPDGCRLIVDLLSEGENIFSQIPIASVSEGARFTPTIIFKTSIANFKLVVVLSDPAF